jgi:hypothetical protein
MKIHHYLIAIFGWLMLTQCKKNEQSGFTPEQQREQLRNILDEVKESGSAPLKASDMPMLPISTGDTWVYSVTLHVPENAQNPGSPLVNQSFERKRTYIGKVKPTGRTEEADCFEIEATGSPVEREYVEITEDALKMRGSEVVGNTQNLPLWMEPAVTLVQAGVQEGESLAPLKITDPRTGAEYSRQIQIIGRETVKTPAREFFSIRILMSGKDGKENPIDMRRTIWFAPGVGIVKEEKARYVNDELLMKEIIELKSYRMKQVPSSSENP